MRARDGFNGASSPLPAKASRRRSGRARMDPNRRGYRKVEGAQALHYSASPPLSEQSQSQSSRRPRGPHASTAPNARNPRSSSTSTMRGMHDFTLEGHSRYGGLHNIGNIPYLSSLGCARWPRIRSPAPLSSFREQSHPRSVRLARTGATAHRQRNDHFVGLGNSPRCMARSVSSPSYH